MIKVMTTDDYEKLFELWKNTPNLPDYRRRGITSNLIERVVDALQKEGITRVCLNVIGTNEQGKKFWLSKGWEKKDFLGFYSKSITDKENLPLFKI